MFAFPWQYSAKDTNADSVVFQNMLLEKHFKNVHYASESFQPICIQSFYAFGFNVIHFQIFRMW